VQRWGGKLNQVQASLTVKVSKPSVSYDAGKKIKGRKRHLLVDTQGFVLKAKVHAADFMDRDGVMLFVNGAANQFPRLRYVWLVMVLDDKPGRVSADGGLICSSFL
jgi:hypothetical protein